MYNLYKSKGNIQFIQNRRQYKNKQKSVYISMYTNEKKETGNTYKCGKYLYRIKTTLSSFKIL